MKKFQGKLQLQDFLCLQKKLIAFGQTIAATKRNLYLAADIYFVLNIYI